MGDSLDDILDTGSSADDTSSSLFSSLSDIANSTITSVAQSASNGISQAATRATTTAPAPDITAAAAKVGGTFINSTVAGISIPVILAGGAAAFFLLSKR